METPDFSVIWPDDDDDKIDDSPAPQPDQRRMRLDFYEQPVLEGLEEESVEQISVSETPTSGVVNSLVIAARYRCGRLLG